MATTFIRGLDAHFRGRAGLYEVDGRYCVAWGRADDEISVGRTWDAEPTAEDGIAWFDGREAAEQYALSVAECHAQVGP
jgi:hypothetical protein